MGREVVDILLIQPPIRDFYLTSKRTIPYGLTSIASALRQKGYSVDILDGLASGRSRVIDYPGEMVYLKAYYGRPDVSPFALFHDFRHFGYSMAHLSNLAKESGAFLIGISSLFTPYSGTALEAAEQIKRACPDSRIVLGGHHPTARYEDVMACPAVDYVLRGEGEISMPLLADSIRSGKSVEDVPGIVYRDKAGRVIASGPATIGELDRLPLPAIDLVHRRYYRRRKQGSMVVVASRGCPMKCSYCAIGTSSYLTYRRRSISSILREIERAAEQIDAGFIDFEDEHLTLDREWFLALLDAIIRRFNGRVELRAMNGLFPPSLDEPVIRKMAQAGFRVLNLSLASTSPTQLKRFDRPDVRAKLESVLNLSARFHLDAVVYIIVGAPGQVAGESVEDLLYLAEQENALPAVSVYYPAPDSSDYRRCQASGLLPRHTSLMRSSALPIADSTSRLETATLLRLGRILSFMRYLAKEGPHIPVPTAHIGEEPLDISDRTAVGMQLLSWFLHDAKIRGITPDGEVYLHRAADRLCEQFVQGVFP